MAASQVTCYGATKCYPNQQEVYETASRDAGRRARQLRAEGFQVRTCPMGNQVTPVGTVKLTLLTIFNVGDFATPSQPSNIVRL